LLALRRQHLVPWLPHARSGRCVGGPGPPLHIRWPLGPDRAWHLLANLSDAEVAQPAPLAGDVVYDSAPGDAEAQAPWWVRVMLEPAAT
jgi:hypothetical protein